MNFMIVDTKKNNAPRAAQASHAVNRKDMKPKMIVSIFRYITKLSTESQVYALQR